MKSFKDNKDRDYQLAINTATLKRVKGLLDADLLDLDKTFIRLIADPIFLCDVLYCLVKPQCDEKDISDESFGEALAGDVIEQAKLVLVEEIRNFFPNPKQRDAVDVAMRKGNLMVDTMRDRGVKMLEAMDMEAEVDKLIAALGNSSTDSPE